MPATFDCVPLLIEDLDLNEAPIRAVVKLLEEGNTIPFHRPLSQRGDGWTGRGANPQYRRAAAVFHRTRSPPTDHSVDD